MKKLKELIDFLGADRRKREIAFYVCLIACLILIWLGGMLDLLWLGAVLGIAVGLSGVVFYRVYSRCPHCGEFLPTQLAKAKHCHHCGKELD